MTTVLGGAYAFCNSSGCVYFLIFPFSLILVSFLLPFSICPPQSYFCLSTFQTFPQSLFPSLLFLFLSFYVFSQISSFIVSTYLLPLCFLSFFSPLFLCFLSLRELYGYFLSPFKNNSFFASSVSALALTLSHCLDINLLLACREAKHTDKLNSHVQRKLQLDSLAVTNNLTPHWLGFNNRLLISPRSLPGHLFHQLSFAWSLLTVFTFFFLISASSLWNYWHFYKYICSWNDSRKQFW